MTNVFAQPNKERLLLLAVGAAVSVLHAGLLWWMLQPGSQAALRHGRVSPPMAMVWIQEPQPSPPPPQPSAQDNNRPLERATAPRSRADAAPTAALPASTRPKSAQNHSEVGTESRTDNDGLASPDSPAAAASARGVPTDRAPLILPGDRDPPRSQKSYAELAQEQLNRGPRRDEFAEGIKSSAVPNCLRDHTGGGLLALPVIIYKSAAGKCNY